MPPRCSNFAVSMQQGVPPSPPQLSPLHQTKAVNPALLLLHCPNLPTRSRQGLYATQTDANADVTSVNCGSYHQLI